MSNNQPRSKSLIIFYTLVAYIIVQFGWWAYMMIDLNTVVYDQQAQIELLQNPAADTLATNERLRSRVYMIAGEGMVFIIILVLGILRIQRTFRREVMVGIQQRNFLLSVTHELKSPIASAKLYMQTLLKRQDLTDEKKEEITRKAIKDTERLASLVENILTATKIDSSSYPVHLESINISELTYSVLADAIETIGQQHTTELAIAENINMDVDNLDFTSMVLNLYENAVKYSPEGTAIAVELKSEGERIVFKVTDKGPGVAKKDAPRIFEKFYRAGNEDTRKTKGTGLGLYIVKQLAQLHNGEVSQRSNTPSGAIFELSFPS
jgi:two-component system phosphate regulon sensor histidine kinase PhoR